MVSFNSKHKLETGLFVLTLSGPGFFGVPGPGGVEGGGGGAERACG